MAAAAAPSVPPISTSLAPHLHKALQLLKPTTNINYTSLGNLIQFFTAHRLLRPGQQLHARLLSLGIKPHNFLASKLINLYAKSGDLRGARQLFDQLPVKNLFLYNALLIGYSLHDCHSETMKLVSDLVMSGIQPDNFTLSCLIRACTATSRNSDRKTAAEIHGYALRNGCDEDVFVNNGLLTMYGKVGDSVNALKLFRGMRARDSVSWNSVIGACVNGGNYEEALCLYEEMGQAGFPKDEITVVSTLQACANLQNLAFGSRIHKQMIVAKEIRIMSMSICNSLVGLYAKCGRMRFAREFFDDMTKRDFVSYGIMIASYMQYGCCGEAMELFGRMMVTGRGDTFPCISTWNTVISGLMKNDRCGEVPALIHEMQLCGIRPNAVTISSALPLCSKLFTVRLGKEMHCYSIRNHHNQNVHVATSIIDMYAKTGMLQEAHKVFRLTETMNTIVYTSLIAGYSSHGRVDECLALFESMQNDGIKPDFITISSVLSVCSRAVAVEDAKRIFDSLMEVHRIVPTMEHFACLVDAYGRAGMLEEAMEFIVRMPIQPNARVWGSLLSAASAYCDPRVGRVAFERLVEIEPEKECNYVILANIYGKAGRWCEVESVRQMMESRELPETQGWSRVELGKEILAVVIDSNSDFQTHTCS